MAPEREGEQLAQQPGHAGGREDGGHGGGVEEGEGDEAGEESLDRHQLDGDDAVHSDEQACLLPSFGETLHGASWWRVGGQVWICVFPIFLLIAILIFLAFLSVFVEKGVKQIWKWCQTNMKATKI